MTMNLLTIKQFSEEHKAFTVGALRKLIFNSESNGLKKALKRIGGRVYINEPDFFAWVDEINNTKGA